MSFLLVLPEALSCDILDQWCDVRDLRKFDSSVRNCSIRLNLCPLLGNVSSSSCLEAPETSGRLFYKWIYLRKIKLSQLYIDNVFD
jgi:hypothetical protein